MGMGFKGKMNRGSLDIDYSKRILPDFGMEFHEACLHLGSNRDGKGQTTGTVNPGVVWAGKSLELGIATEIPVNSRSGKSAGVLGLVHLFLDDLFPKSIGRPIFH
jgi:hypothetical protein